MPAKLHIDLGMCQGHGRCYELAPDLIEADDDGLAVLTEQGAIDETRAADIAGSCPEFAIEMEEAS